MILDSIAKYDINYNKTCIVNTYDNSLSLSNPSILWDDRTLFINFRCINYFSYISKNEKYVKNINGWISSDSVSSFNCFSYLNSGNSRFYKKIKIEPNTRYKYSGLEDAILTNWNGKKYLCGTRCDTVPNKAVFCIYELNDIFDINREIVIDDNRTNTIEKHWSPIEGEPFTFIRWSNPTEIVKIDDKTGSIVNIVKKESSSLIYEGIRGNCQTVKYKNGYLTITHTTERKVNFNCEIVPSYKHYFVYYNSNFEIEKVSKPFSFETNDIEFCCGLQYKDNKVYVSYSVFDTLPRILEFGEEIVEKLLDGFYSEDNESEEYTNNGLYEMSNMLLSKNQYYSAASCYSRIFSNTNDKELEYNSLMKFCVCLLILKYNGRDIFTNEMILSFIDELFMLNNNKAEPYYLYSIYYGLLGDLNKKEVFKNLSTKYRFEFPEIKRYLKIW